jgi:hypothetical protein
MLQGNCLVYFTMLSSCWNFFEKAFQKFMNVFFQICQGDKFHASIQEASLD